MINIAVCDDDLEITKSINKLLMKYQDERDLDFTVDLFNDGSGLKSSILKGKKYDLIYLDIEMRQMNGIATAKYIRSIDTTVLLIYVSNYDNYLKELFEVEPFRFMSKPINDKRFYMFLAIEMLLGYTIMSIVKGNDYANFELLCSIICKIIMLALVKIIPLVIDPSIECDMPSKYCFMLTVLPVISTVVVYNIFLITSRIDRLELIAFSTVSSTLILALNLLVYDIYIKLLEQTEIRRENAIYEKQISLFQEQIYVKETAMLNDKMVRDKFYHQLSFIKELVYQRELSQLNEFIDGIMQNKKIEKDGPANSGNVLLDYIVNNKCEIAVKQGIECTVKIEVPYKFPFSDGDIFIILGNALDNAIEGALKCVSRRYIHIKIIYRKENLFIKISNSFDGKVKKDRHGHLISMKSDLTRYGLGLALIEKSVNKYNGLLNFDIDEENFTLTVLLYS